MDQNQTQPPEGTSLFEMDFDASAQIHLKNISNWGKFIGITLLILLALVVMALAINYQQIIDQVSSLMSLNNTAVGIIVTLMIIIGGLCIVWLIYLLRGCTLIKKGLLSQNSDSIAEGFRSLKIIFIIGIIFSSLSILSTIISMINY